VSVGNYVADCGGKKPAKGETDEAVAVRGNSSQFERTKRRSETRPSSAYGERDARKKTGVRRSHTDSGETRTRVR